MQDSNQEKTCEILASGWHLRRRKEVSITNLNLSVTLWTTGLLRIHLFCPVLCLVAQSCLTLCDPMDCSLPGSSVHGNSPGRNTGEGCHALLQGIFPMQGSNPGLPALQEDS